MALCLGILVSSSVYIVLSAAGGGAHLGIVAGDQLLYMQYARNMATDHPYVFTLGDTPSTGSTSHIYPMLLAGIYTLGFHGDSFLAAIFILNSLFYLGIITCVWFISLKMAPRIMPYAVFMTVFSGHTLSTTFSQTDMGLFSLLALSTFSTLLCRRYKWTVVLAFLCGLTRPEGFVFSVAFFLCGAGALLLDKKSEDTTGSSRRNRYFLLAGLAGFIAFCLTLYVNYHMTGYIQFMSVMNKGYFATYPFFGAVIHTLSDTATMLKGVFLGLSDSPRQFFVFPVLGGLLGLCGILLFPRNRKSVQLCEWWFLLSAGATLLSIASSQWQGLSNDRYLGWIAPLWLIYTLIGVEQIATRIRIKTLFPMLISLLFAYQAISTAYFYSYAFTSSTHLEKWRNFSERIAKETSKGERFGSTFAGGMQYFNPDHQVYTLHGITSAAFFSPKFDSPLFQIIEIVKHQPNLQFENWLIQGNNPELMAWVKPFLGDLKLQDTDSAITAANGSAVYSANWDAIKGGDLPVLLTDELTDLKLIDQMDIGYQPDETKHRFENTLRLPNLRIPIVCLTAKLGNKTYSEVGRLIAGKESFSVHHVQPNHPLTIVLRTARSISGTSYFGSQKSAIENYELNKTINLNILVDGVEVPSPALHIDREGFNEIVLRIPKEYIECTTPRIEIIGDHISFAYWFYQ